MTESTISYRIDDGDRIVSVGEAWERFGYENEAGALTASAVVGASIWNFIAGEKTQQLYVMLFESVRKHSKEVKVPFRCDSPTTRRYMELVISPLRDRTLSFVCREVKSEERPFVALLDSTRQPNPGQFLTICSWCKKVRLPNESWVEVESAVQALRLFEAKSLPSLTHGICHPCADMIRAETLQPLPAASVQKHE